jgi:Zn-finger protein
MTSNLWAQVWISVHPNKNELDEKGCWKCNFYHSHLIRKWNYPKWIIDRHKSFFTWVQALVQSRFRGHYVQFCYCGYYPETKERMASRRQREISSAKAQVTRIENLISEYKKEKSKTLWQDPSSDAIYQKLILKLAEKKRNMKLAEEMPVEETIQIHEL